MSSFINESEKNIQIPEGIKSIQGGMGIAAFYEKGLESVVLPNSLENIYSHAFYGNNLTEILIPANVKFIGHQSFKNNPITKITMTNDPAQVNIQDRAFGIGYTESKLITDAFIEAYSSNGAGTYEWTGDKWIKTE